MASIIVPRTIHHGLGSLEKLRELTGRKAVVVTGHGSMKKFGHLDRTLELLKAGGIASTVFEGVEPDPSFETVMKGTAVLQEVQPDLIIGLGGCSAIDAAKVMWVFYEYPETKTADIIPPFTIRPLRKKATFVAIPSTSGTGTEVTCVAVITDRQKGVKYPIVSYEITPDIAIVDGAICQDMPPHVTANTGLDALAHDVEAFAATLASPYTDALVVRSVRMIFEWLPTAFDQPRNLPARQAMHDASCMAGMAFTNALLGIVHSMAHQLGGTFGIPHGRANAILLPNVVRYNSRATTKYAELAALVGQKDAAGLAEEIERLRTRVGVEASLSAYGIDSAAFQGKLDDLTDNALSDPCTGTNPRKPSREEMKRLFECCYKGERVSF